jgi:hypothetical protein
MAVEQPASSAAALEEEAEAEQTSDDEGAEGEAEEESSGSDASGEAGDPLDSTAKKRKKKKVMAFRPCNADRDGFGLRCSRCHYLTGVRGY